MASSLAPGWKERFEQFDRQGPVRVLICDPTWEELTEMKEFINNSKLNLITIDGVDVSDHSVTTDMIYEYIFGNEQDALLFRLKYSK